mgnify:CR=1 FL=1
MITVSLPLVTSFDFFETAELPVPEITCEQARAIAAQHFGVHVTADALGSQQDANFLLRDDDGHPVGVLKVANPAFSRTELEAQDAAAAFIAAGEGLRTATNLEPAGVEPIAEITGETGDSHRLFARIDLLVLLAAPGWEVVARWREQQEAELRASGGPAVMSLGEVLRFIQHYERLTRWILEEMPARADLTVRLGEGREVLALDPVSLR